MSCWALSAGAKQLKSLAWRPPGWLCCSPLPVPVSGRAGTGQRLKAPRLPEQSARYSPGSKINKIKQRGNKGPSKTGSQVYLQTEYGVKGPEQRCCVRDSH